MNAMEMPNTTQAEVFRRAAQFQRERGHMKLMTLNEYTGAICGIASLSLALFGEFKGIQKYGVDFRCREGDRIIEYDTLFSNITGANICFFNNMAETTSETLSTTFDKVAEKLENAPEETFQRRADQAA